MKSSFAAGVFALVGTLTTSNAVLQGPQQHIGSSTGYSLKPSTLIIQSAATATHPANFAKLELYISVTGTVQEEVKARTEGEVERLKGLLEKASTQSWKSPTTDVLAVESIVASKVRVNEESGFSRRRFSKCPCDNENAGNEAESTQYNGYSAVSASFNNVHLLPELYNHAENASTELSASLESVTVGLGQLDFQLVPAAKAEARKTLRKEAVNALFKDARESAESFGYTDGVGRLIELEEINPELSEEGIWRWYGEDSLVVDGDEAEWEAPGVTTKLHVKGKFAMDAQ